MIETCRFGKMAIFGQTYTTDLMILPDGAILDSWRRASGHYLVLEDIQAVLEAAPQIVVAGTGIYGRMQTDARLEAHLTEKGIEFIAQRTKKAAQTFNKLVGGEKKVAGCFHLTC